MFVMGAVLLASSALLPPYLQNLGGYTVTDTGLLMVPRGIGTMFAMMFAGRLAHEDSIRALLMTVGTALLLWSMWDMSGWTPRDRAMADSSSSPSFRASAWASSSCR